MQHFTQHARRRIQQRAIPTFIVSLLDQYGSEFRTNNADIIIFDKHAKMRLRQAFGGARGLKAIERWLDAYAIVADDGTFLTVGHRHARVGRP